MKILPVAFILTCLVVSGCGKNKSESTAPPAPVVTVAPVVEKELIEWTEFTGQTEAVEAVEVRPRVSGYIQEVRFQSGQLVKKGDVLFVIDPRPYQAEVEQREAELEQAKARHANAGRMAHRADQLLKSSAISSEEADTSISDFHQARAAVLAAEAALKSARLDLEFTEVRAPIDGRVSRALLTTGNYVSGNAGGASLLTTIVSVDPIYVYADVDERSLLQLQALMTKQEGLRIPVEMQLADEEGYPHRGFIESLDNRVDRNTGTIVLRAQIPNPDGRIIPGLFVRLRVPLSEERPTLLVDETAIGTDQAQKFVFSIGKDNTVEYRKVTLGPVADGKRIVRSGLNAGDMIIVNGVQRARPGAPVTPQPQVAQDSASSAGPNTAAR